MAASMAAAIENKFGLRAELVEGHDGIYEIAVNGRLVYSNQACAHPPLEETVFAEIRQYQTPLAETAPVDNAPNITDAPFCVWTPPAAAS
jgi:hypothetical protein